MMKTLVANVLVVHEQCGKIMFFSFDDVLFQFCIEHKVHTLVKRYAPVDIFCQFWIAILRVLLQFVHHNLFF